MTGPLTKNQTVAVYESHGQDSRVKDPGDTCLTVSAKYGTGGGNTPIVCAFDYQSGGDCRGLKLRETAQLQALQKPAVMVHWQQGGGEVEDEVSGALRANAEHSYQFARIQSTVRRLTPRECERLQGFPDDHTLIPWKSLKAWAKQAQHMFKCKGCGTVFNDKHAGGVGWLSPAECPTCGEESATVIEQCSFEDHLLTTTGRGLREPTTEDCPDGPRYKALGNSMAVPCVEWILGNLRVVWYAGG